MLRFAPILFVVLAGCSKAEGAETGPGSAGGPSAKEISKADLNEHMEMQRNLLKEVTDVLASVTDVASAEKAKPDLAELADQVEPLRERGEELVNEAGTAQNKLAFAQDAMGMMGEISRLTDELQRLENVPGVRAVLEEPMERIMAFFDPSQR